MASSGNRFLGLCLPPMVLCALDATLTLLGQPSEYWSGDYRVVNELSPTFNHLLQAHPLAFAAGIIVWVAMFSALILLLPITLALIIDIAATFGSAAGAASWILFRFQFGYQVANGLFLFAAVLLACGIRWNWKKNPEQVYCFPGLMPAWRWGLAAALFAAGVYLAIWPRMP